MKKLQVHEGTNKKDKVVLAYSGGLDTSVMVKWLQLEMNLDVVAICANVGQDHADLEWIKEKAYKMGAVYADALDVRAEYAKDYLSKAICANGLYQQKYPLLSALSRPLIVSHLVKIAHATGAKYIAHGCTGKGNDQVRFEASIHALDPTIEVLAPVREWDLHSREEEMLWAAAHDVPVPTTKAKPYSIDDNLFGRAIECGALENPWKEPPADIWTLTQDPLHAPDEPLELTIAFKQGIPISVNGQQLPLHEMIAQLNSQVGAQGYGRLDLIEDRVVGIKSHECYECPAALALIEAHQALEALTLDKDSLAFKKQVEQSWSTLVYNGLWFSPLKNNLDAFIASSQQFVTGEVKLRIYKGSLTIIGRKSEYSLYQENLATYSDHDSFNHGLANGFIGIHSLPLSTWSQVQGPTHTSVVADSDENVEKSVA